MAGKGLNDQDFKGSKLPTRQVSSDLDRKDDGAKLTNGDNSNGIIQIDGKRFETNIMHIKIQRSSVPSDKTIQIEDFLLNDVNDGSKKTTYENKEKDIRLACMRLRAIHGYKPLLIQEGFYSCYCGDYVWCAAKKCRSCSKF